MDLLSALDCFRLVVGTGSLSAAARRSGSSQSAVTRQLAQLEDHFGVRLLHRTTRRLSLTQDGEDLLAHASHLLETAAEMEEALGRHRTLSTGHVRLGTSVAFGLFLAPRLPALLDAHPGLSVELVMGDRAGNMIEERLDLSTIVGDVADTSLVVRRMGEIGRLPVASRAYLDRAGTPGRPEQLREHSCLVHDTGAGNAATWSFDGPDGRVTVPVHGSFSATVGEAVHLAALAGGGIAMLPSLQVADGIRAGRLVRLFDGWRPLRNAVVIAYPSRRNLASRTRVVLDFVMQQVTELKHHLDPPAAADPARSD